MPEMNEPEIAYTGYQLRDIRQIMVDENPVIIAVEHVPRSALRHELFQR